MSKTKKEPKKMGRPLIQIDWATVEKLCAIQCTGEEIAGVLGICYDTLETAIKREHKLTFSDYYKQKSSVGKISLRRSQYQNATERMNATMQIWLGKQWLGQQDTQYMNVVNETSDVRDKSDEELLSLLKKK